MDIRSNIEYIKKSIAKLNVNNFPNIVAVSKKHPVPAIIEALDSNIEHIGESYLQEAVDKINKIKTKKVIWNFIGSIQSNKLKPIVQNFDRIHSVSKIKHIRLIDRYAREFNRHLEIFIQVNFAKELTKSGVDSYDNLLSLLDEAFSSNSSSFKIVGLMTIPPKNLKPARFYFAELRETLEKVNQKLGIRLDSLSMGMSSDYLDAVLEGSTDLRIGTAIFGARDAR